MRFNGILVALLFIMVNNLRASEVDSSFGITFGLGYSNYESQQSGGALNFKGSISWNTSWILNYAGLSHSKQIQPFTGEDQPYQNPNDYENAVFIGHQFRNNSSMAYFPVSIGISGSNGVYRGSYLRNDDNGIYIRNEFYQRKTFYAPGVFFDVTPSLLIGKTFATGLNLFLNLNTHEIEMGAAFQMEILDDP